MIIQNFRRMQNSNFAILAVMVLLLRLPILFDNNDIEITNTFLDIPKPFGILPYIEFNVVPNIIFSAILVYIQAIIFVNIINKHNFFNRSTFVPALMYVLVCSMFAPFLLLSNALICNFILLWILDLLFSIYRTSYVLSSITDIGILIAIGTLIYSPFVVIVLLLYVCLVVFRVFDWREWVSGLVGFSIPYIIVFTYYFFIGDLVDKIQVLLSLEFHSPIEMYMQPIDYFATVPFIVVIILALGQFSKVYSKNVIQVRKSLQCLGFLLGIILVTYLFIPSLTTTYLLVMGASFATFLTFYFNLSNNVWLYEGLFGLLALSVFYFQMA
jgi:hypothetical protein